MSMYILLCNYRGGAGLWGHFICAIRHMVQGFCSLPFTQNHIVFFIFVSELTCMSFSFSLAFLITLFPCGQKKYTFSSQYLIASSFLFTLFTESFDVRLGCCAAVTLEFLIYSWTSSAHFWTPACHLSLFLFVLLT